MFTILYRYLINTSQLHCPSDTSDTESDGYYTYNIYYVDFIDIYN